MTNNQYEERIAALEAKLEEIATKPQPDYAAIAEQARIAVLGWQTATLRGLANISTGEPHTDTPTEEPTC